MTLSPLAMLNSPHPARLAAGRTQARSALHRLRSRVVPIGQTAAAAVVAWNVAVLLLPDPQPVFASIAAVITLAAAFGQRFERAIELVGGVLLGAGVAMLTVHTVGTGAWQMGAMVVAATGIGVLLGGGHLMVSEAAISAMLLASLETTGAGLSPDRFLEGVIGGTVALLVHSVLFPPDPALAVGRAAQAVLAELGRSLEEIAKALEDGDTGRAERALVSARGIDASFVAFDEALAAGRENPRIVSPRDGARVQVARYRRSRDQVDFAVRNTRVLARHAVRFTRREAISPAPLSHAVHDLSGAVWALAASYDEPARAAEARDLALRAAAGAVGAADREHDPAIAEIAGQVRLAAVDVFRGVELAGHEPGGPDDQPTEELLLAA